MLRHGLRTLCGGLRHRPWGQFAPPAAAGALGLPAPLAAPGSRSLWHRDGEESVVSRRTFDVVTIADSDSTVRAKGSPGTFVSLLKHFTLEMTSHGCGLPQTCTLQADLEGEASISTQYAYGERGGEFSELLLTPSGTLYTICDRTGILFEVYAEPSGEAAAAAGGAAKCPTQPLELTGWEQYHGRQLREKLSHGAVRLVPWVVLGDGDGRRANGFKGEWASVKGGDIVVGSHGYEIWPGGVAARRGEGIRNVQFVKHVDMGTGRVSHHDWGVLYNNLMEAAGVEPPGYLTHESAAWSEGKQRWYFLPRRLSPSQAWHAEEDAERGCNLLLSCDERGGNVEVVHVQGVDDPTRGFSAMRFVPGCGDDVIAATKTVEQGGGGEVHTYLTVIHVDGSVLLPETYVGPVKFEGLEITEIAGAADDGGRLAKA